MRSLKWLLILTTLLLFPTVVYPDSSPQNDVSVIAYVSPSRENQQIRLINPDGSNDRVLWSVPQDTIRSDGIGSLSWNPDATELAFDSGHEWQRSIWVRDLYGVVPDGSRVRRLTNAPIFSALSTYPQGQVTVQVDNPSGVGTELLVYLEGSEAISQFTAVAGGRYTITFPRVADYGPNVRQFVRMIDLAPRPNLAGNNCYYDLAVFADVISGQTVDAGLLRGSASNAFNCAAPFSPSWRADGVQVAYLMETASTRISRPNDIWQIPANPPLQSAGERVLDMNQYVTSDKLFLVAMGPADQADQMLFVQNGATSNFIYRAPVTDAAQNRLVDLGLCPRTVCRILGLAWLPDGSGFFFSRVESGASLGNPPPEGGAIYRYDFASSRFSEVFRLPGEAIGRIALSPDGRTLAFERAASLDRAIGTINTGPRLLCPCSLWLVGAEGTNPRQLVADGRAPAWSSRAPTTLPAPPGQPAPPTTAPPSGNPRIFLPMVRR